MAKKAEKPIRKVARLPKKAVLNEVIYNKADGFFYMGIDTKKEALGYGSSVEKTGV